MRKVCFILGLLAFLSAMHFPAYAIKLITNNELDRTVPSRCSGPSDEFVQDDYGQVQNNNANPVSNKVIKKQKDNFERYYKPILGEDFRIELLGIRWNYPSDEEQPNQSVENNQYYENVNYENNEQKRYIREAADYYIYDTLRDGNDNNENSDENVE